MSYTYQFYAWQNIVSVLPLVLVVLYGLVVAACRWNRHPRVSLLAIVALGLLLAAVLGARLLTLILVYRGLSVEAAPMLVLVAGLISSGGGAVAVGLLLWAAFGWRGAPAKPRRPDDDHLS